MKTDYKNIYTRSRLILLQPDHIWPALLEETTTMKNLFFNYLFPVVVLSSLLVLALSLIRYNLFQAIGLSVINLTSALCGTWFSYLITREYLCSKLNYPVNQALNLTVYSSVIFLFFHSIGSALGDLFLGQLFTLLSFIFIRTLYAGIKRLPDLPNAHKTNILIIVSLAIICIPIIISQVLMIVFRISAITI